MRRHLQRASTHENLHWNPRPRRLLCHRPGRQWPRARFAAAARFEKSFTDRLCQVACYLNFPQFSHKIANLRSVFLHIIMVFPNPRNTGKDTSRAFLTQCADSAEVEVKCAGRIASPSHLVDAGFRRPFSHPSGFTAVCHGNPSEQRSAADGLRRLCCTEEGMRYWSTPSVD
jgi:hypothetical protein